MQPIRFCGHDGCFAVAIKTKRSEDRCREHYRSDVLAVADNLVACEVIPSVGRQGRRAGVTDAVTNQRVEQGPVTLDPLETNIAAVVATGILRVLPGKAADKVKAKA